MKMREEGRSARGRVEPRAGVGDVGLCEARIGDCLQHRTMHKQSIRCHRSEQFALDRITRGKRPVLRIGRVSREPLDRAHNLARDIRFLERRIQFEAVAEVAKVAAHGGRVVADTGHKTKAGDENSGHA